jgi:hypothetical protein
MSHEVKYTGMDVHQEAIVSAVLNESGKLVMECVIETKASSIVQLQLDTARFRPTAFNPYCQGYFLLEQARNTVT